jgi:hypothetical protein
VATDIRDIGKEDFRYHERYWNLQVAGWFGVLAIIVAALTGVFGGGGAFSRASVERSGLRIEYSRFERMSSPTDLTLTVLRPPGSDVPNRIWISRSYLDSFEVSSITPKPESQSVESDRITYSFRPAANETERIVLRMQADAGVFGLLAGQAGVPGGASVAFRQLIWP